MTAPFDDAVAVASTTRVDLHCHSTASEISRLGVQRAVGLPECATPPAEVYELAKRRGMDFVTITDHDTIDGVLQIAHLPGVFVSEELTAWFRGQPQAVHVLCYDLTPADHEWLQAHNGDVEGCAEYLRDNDIVCALAHPYYTVGAPLTPHHRRRLADLFPVWEVRNGSRARELNRPAAVYIATREGTGIGGSDDHAGVDIGRTFTEAPPAATPAEFLAHLDERGLIDHMQDAGFSHADLYRRACRAHERRLRGAVAEMVLAVEAETGTRGASTAGEAGGRTLGEAAGGDADILRAATGLFQGCMAAIPYAPATAFLGNEKAKLDSREGERPRVAILADGIGCTHGVTRTIEEIRRRGVPGFEIEVIGTDPEVDRRLPAVAEIDVPFYPGMKIGVPSLTAAVEILAEGSFDVIHVCSPGPVGIAGALVARGLRRPLVGSYHTELTAYAALRSQNVQVASAMDLAVRSLYTACDLVLSPSPASDEALQRIGVSDQCTARWDRGVDTARFTPALRGGDTGEGPPANLPERGDAVNVLYAGRITREKGSELLAEAFLEARRSDPRLHLVLAGGGPELQALRERVGEHATFLGWLEGHELARAYAAADIFLFPSATDTFGQVILEAQASGLPVVAVAEGGPLSLVRHRVNGLLCTADARDLAARVVELAGSPQLRRRLAAAGLASVEERTWERALERLAEGYLRALARDAGEGSDTPGDSDTLGEDARERRRAA